MDTGTTAFILCCIIGLTVMVPGLALFYGGMVSVRSTVNMMLMTFGAVAVIGVLWVLFGFSMVFGDSVGGIVGNPTQYAGLPDLLEQMTTVDGLPLSLFAVFQALFAALTVAIVSGVAADRMKFGAWMLFAAGWAVLCYFPVAHWVFAFDGVVSESATGGWVANQVKAIDFAGGTAVHINAGAAALALAIVLGPSKTWTSRRPHNVPLNLLGVGLLWAGWYAFNGGSALASGTSASVVMLTTFTATCAAILAWLAVEKWREGSVTGIGAGAGAIAGLVAITPACGAVTPLGALVVGAVAGLACPFAVSLKDRYGYDDSTDVVGVHLVGGVIGTLLVGLLATDAMPSGANGLFHGGGFEPLGKQALAAAAVLLYSFVITFAIAWVLKKTIGIRISDEDEEAGIDSALHRHTAYDLV